MKPEQSTSKTSKGKGKGKSKEQVEVQVAPTPTTAATEPINEGSVTTMADSNNERSVDTGVEQSEGTSTERQETAPTIQTEPEIAQPEQVQTEPAQAASVYDPYIDFERFPFLNPSMSFVDAMVGIQGIQEFVTERQGHFDLADKTADEMAARLATFRKELNAQREGQQLDVLKEAIRRGLKMRGLVSADQEAAAAPAPKTRAQSAASGSTSTPAAPAKPRNKAPSTDAVVATVRALGASSAFPGWVTCDAAATTLSAALSTARSVLDKAVTEGKLVRLTGVELSARLKTAGALVAGSEPVARSSYYGLTR